MKGRHILCCWMIAIMGVLSQTASANLLRNPSFEQAPCTTPCNQDQAFMPSDWLSLNVTPDTYSNDGSYGLPPGGFGNFTGATAQDGIRWVAGWSLIPEVFGQVLSAPLIPEQEYTLSAYLREAVRADLAHPGTYQIELWDSTNFFSADKIVLGSLLPLIANQNAWELRTLTFTAPSGATTHTVLAFRPLGSAEGEAYPGIDNVVLEAFSPVNQPPTITSFTATPSNGILPVSGAGVPVTFTVVASDPDGTLVQAQWDFTGNGSVDRVTTTLTTSFTYTAAGTFHPTVTVVDNGGATASAATTVTIKTPIQAIKDLITSVQGLPLNDGQKNSLISKLNAASDAINRGNLTAACNQLGAFINEVNALVQSQQLDQTIGQGLLGDAQAIQGALGCR
jgi:hypothetical protein